MRALKKKKKRLPHPEWVGGVSVKEIFLKQVPGRCSLARVKFFSRKNVSRVFQSTGQRPGDRKVPGELRKQSVFILIYIPVSSYVTMRVLGGRRGL